jgi:putative transposase
VVDEYTLECLVLKVGRGITSGDVIDTFAELFAMRGVSKYIRSDNGPEFIVKELRAWLGRVGVPTLYIEPDSLWENGHVESFHSRFRDERLALEVFDGLRGARAIMAARKDDYNHRKPHRSLGFGPRPGSPPRVRLPPRPRRRLQPHTLIPLVNPVPKPSRRLVQQIQAGQKNAVLSGIPVAQDVITFTGMTPGNPELILLKPPNRAECALPSASNGQR